MPLDIQIALAMMRVMIPAVCVAFLSRDHFLSLPLLVPEGPIGILGLAGGTVAHLIHKYYPDRRMVGWELDFAVVMAARLHMGLEALESQSVLTVHTGDALGAEVGVDGGFAGIIVDLFAGGKLLEPLKQVGATQCARAHTHRAYTSK